MSKTLYIFDFDGTLFKSPEPNPSIWNASIVGKIKSMPDEGGFGWFQDTITLDDPYVPTKPDRDIWFNKNVLDDALNALKNQDNVVCLLTGRTVLYENIIDRILESVELKFHHKGLKPLNVANVQRETTFDFKKKFILNLMNNIYKDEIKRVIIYEDRINHVDLFNSFLATLSTLDHYHVKHIEEEPKYLENHSELSLVDYLVTKNTSPKAELKKLTDYTGLVLDKQSIDKILSLVEIPKGWYLKAHHVTLNLGPINHKLWKPLEKSSDSSDETKVLNDIKNLSISETSTTTTTTANCSVVISNDVSSIQASSSTTTTTSSTVSLSSGDNFEDIYKVGTKWTAKIEAVGFSQNALAFKVQGIPTANVIPHCTIAIHPNGKASDSNSIRNWYPINTLKLGERVSLNSYDERELSIYKELIEKQDKVKLDSPSKGNSNPHNKKSKNSGADNNSHSLKEPCVCFVTLPLNLNETDVLTLSGEIMECGKLSYEVQKPPKKEKIQAYPIIQRAIPELSKAEILKIVPKVTEWIVKSNTTDLLKIEQYIKDNFNDLKK
ncbi:hypothetical protein RB653_004051 [Dictyostelium firmibasis]|uniref:Swiss Army Knife RNA repair protein HAD domain-containing protein n=1 Tax=Dictyostelium firmibasis TaxID=79012 RepID=A0AAN7YWP2_9MYCE